MQKKQVTVMVRLKAKKGMGERLKAAALGLIEKTRQEPGCINYHFHASGENPDLFMFYENWKSFNDLGEHLSMPYLLEFQNLLREILADKEEFTTWDMLE